MLAIQRIKNAFLFLSADPQRLEVGPAQRFDRTGWAMMLLAAAWGLILVGIWDRAFHLTFSRWLNWVVPSSLCAVVMVLGLAGRPATSLLEVLAGRRWWLLWPGRAAMATGIALMLNYAVRWWDPDWPTQLPPGWMWLWPRALYRTMLLMPLWGVWGMLALGQFRRPGPRTDEAARRLIQTTGPLTAAAMLAVPLAGTFVYFMFLPPAMRFVPPAAAAVAAIGGGSALAGIGGGISRRVMLATNCLTQLAFLAAYLAVR